MTRTASTARWLTAAGAGFAALALLASPIPATSASADTGADVVTAPALTVQAAKTTKVPTATIANDFASIFASQMPSLTNAGWAACASPITWSVDVSELSAAEGTEQVANLQWALDQWAAATGLAFQYTGTMELAYDDTYFTLSPADGSPVATRHIYLAIVDDANSDRLGGGTVGLGGPSQVWPSSKEITGGVAVFRTDHVAKASVRADRSLYLHELGHVLGLAHASETANIMYPVVTEKTELGAGDLAGVRSMAKPCTEAA